MGLPGFSSSEMETHLPDAGFISNVTYGVCLGIAWISFVKATGKSPLAAGQWPAFLGFYAGLWTMQVSWAG